VPGVVHNALNRVGAIRVHFSVSNKLSFTANQVIFADQFTGAGTVLGDFKLAFPNDMSMTWGDFNGDGTGDLAVEVSTISKSAVLVLYGSPTGLSTTNFTVLVVDDGLSENNLDGQPQTCGEGNHFCAESRGHVALAAADLDGDSRTELLIGAPNCVEIDDAGSIVGQLPFEGCVAIVPGNSAGLDHYYGWNVLDHGFDDLQGGFGAALAVGDFDNDGTKDVAVGAPNTSRGPLPTNSGTVRVFANVHLFPGHNELAGFASSTLLTQNTPGIETAETGDRFGAALAANDFNGDGDPDLAIGAPGESIGTATGIGHVSVIFGLAGTGLSATASTGHPAAQKFTGLLTAEAFGSSLSAWNFGKTGQADLAIGAPFRDQRYPGSGHLAGTTIVITGAGAVRVLYGASPGGLSTEQTWRRNNTDTSSCPTCTGGKAKAGAHFGAAVY